MFVFLVSRTRVHTDLFGCVGGNFIGCCSRGVGDFGCVGGSPGFGLGFCFVGGGGSGFVGAEFAEVEFLDGVLVMDGGCCDGADEERWTNGSERAHTGGLERRKESVMHRGECVESN